MPGNIITIDPVAVAHWPAANYKSPPLLNVNMTVFHIVIFVLVTIVCGTRIVLRVIGKAGKFGLDDALLILAWLFGLAFTINGIFLVTKGLANRDIWNLEIDKWSVVAEVTWIAEFTFLYCAGLTKVSVLLFYRRLIRDTYSKQWRWAIWAAIALVVAYTVTFTILLFTVCTPWTAYWQAFDPKYITTHEWKCMDTRVVNILAGVFATITDLYSVVLPCVLVGMLQMRKSDKIGVMVIFALGLVVTGISGVRTYWLIKTGYNSNVSKSIFYACVWSELELSLGMMCASAPTLRVFIRTCIEHGSRYFSSSIRSSKNDRTPTHSAGMEEKGFKNTTSSVQEKDYSPRAANRNSRQRVPSADDLRPLTKPPGAGYTITPSISAQSVGDEYYTASNDVHVQQDVHVERRPMDV